MSDDQAAIKDAELKREAALKDGDMAGLEKMLAGNFRYIHATGRVETRDAYLASVATGKNKFLKFETSDVVIDVHGDVSVASGAIAMTVHKEGAETVGNMRYASIWLRSGSGWQLSFWQSTTNTLA